MSCRSVRAVASLGLAVVLGSMAPARLAGQTSAPTPPPVHASVTLRPSAPQSALTTANGPARPQAILPTLAAVKPGVRVVAYQSGTGPTPPPANLPAVPSQGPGQGQGPEQGQGYPDHDHTHPYPRPPYYYPGPIIIVTPPPYVPPPQIPTVIGPVGGGLMLPNPGEVPDAMRPAPPRRNPPRPDPAKADGLVTIGDRLFRVGNTRRAADRYEQARRANPNSARPLIRLAQAALVWGDYKGAAEQIRAANAAEPGWLVNADDVQALYAEPGDFAKQVARLETHLQANPRDRDGWLVLGAELFLSGKTRQASDVFSRLNDRKPDATLAAFLDATTPDAPARP